MGPMKPPVGYDINWSHPLAKGLVGCWLFNEKTPKLRNIAAERRGYTSTFSGTPSYRGLGGGCLNFNAATPDWIQLGSATGDFQIGTGSFSFGLLFFSSNSTSQVALGTSTGFFSPGYDFVTSLADIPGFCAARVYDDGIGALIEGGLHIFSPSVSRLHFGGGILDRNGNGGAGLFHTFLDGSRSNGADASTVANVTNTQALRLGNRNDALYYTGQIGLVVLYNRALSPSEVAWLYEEPYAFIRSPSRPAFARQAIVAPVQSLRGVRRKRSWNKQKPPVGYDINWSHPLSRGLVFCMIHRAEKYPYDMVSGQYATLQSLTGESSVFMGNEGIYKNAAASFRFPVQTGLDKIVGSGSMFCVGRPNDAGYGLAVGSWDVINTGNGYLGIGFEDNRIYQPNGPVGILNDGTSAGLVGSLSADYLGSNSHLSFHRLGMTFTSNTSSLKWYVKGKPLTGSTFVAAPDADTNRRTQMFCQTFNLHAPTDEIAAVLVYAWNRTLTAAEMMWLYEESYSFIRSPARAAFARIPIAAAGSLKRRTWISY
jgi:hypothetical protein